MENVPISAVYCDIITVAKLLKFCTKVHSCTIATSISSWLEIISNHGAIRIVLSPLTRIFGEKMEKVIFQPFKEKIFTV